MPAKKNGVPENLKEIAGYPGLYTPINVTRNPKKEKALWTRILRDAEKIRKERLAQEALLQPRAKPFLRLRAAFPFLKI